MDMKPISFAFGAGTKIDSPHGGKIRTKTKVEDSQNETKLTKSKGSAKTQDREKLKTNEPNAPLQKPDFSNEAKPKVVSSDPHSKGDRSVRRDANLNDKPNVGSHGLVAMSESSTKGAKATSIGELELKSDLKIQSMASVLGVAPTVHSYEQIALIAAPIENEPAVSPEDSVALNPKAFVTGEVKSPILPTVGFPIEEAKKIAQNVFEPVEAVCAMPIRQSPELAADSVSADPTFKEVKESNEAVCAMPIRQSTGIAYDAISLASLIKHPAQDLVDPMELICEMPIREVIKEDARAIKDVIAKKLTIEGQGETPIVASFEIEKAQIAKKQFLSGDGETICSMPPIRNSSLLGSNLANGLNFVKQPAQDLAEPIKMWPTSNPIENLADPKAIALAPQTGLAGVVSQPIKGLVANGINPIAPTLSSADSAVMSTKNDSASSAKIDPSLTSDNASAPVSPTVSFATNVANAMAVVNSSTFTGAILESASALFDDLKSEKIDVKSEEQESTPVTGFDHVTSRTQKADAHVVDARPLTKSEVSNVLEQVADRLEALAASKLSKGVTIQLKPFDLGEITMMIKGSGKSIEAEISASHESVRHALEQAQKHLSANLEARGYSLANITISDSSATNSQTTYSDAQSQLANQNGQSANGSRSTTNFTTPNGAVETTQRNAFTAKADGVDYWI